MIDTLVLSGGGLKGFSIIESINQLIINKIINLKNIKNYYGTSVGTIISFLLCIGYSMEEIIFFTNNFNFGKISEDINIDDLLTNFGLSSGKTIMSILQALLFEKINKYNITFEDIYEKFKKKINIVVTNITDGVEEIFSFDDTPKTSVLIAIRMSIAVPIIFTPVEYNNKKYLDGGLVNNFPINHVKSENYLGIACNFNIKKNLSLFHEYIFNFLHITIKTISLKNITKNNIERIIFLENYEEISELDFNENNILKLKKAGSESTLNFINKNNLVITKIKFINFLKDNIQFITDSFNPSDI